MTRDEAAAALDGGEYGNEGSSELFQAMKAAGLVAVFGASDDLMEFRGAINDEVGCYNGGTAYLTSEGLLENPCEDGCPYFEKVKKSAATIDAIWDSGGYSWQYAVAGIHSTAGFVIKENGEPYCEGIVFDLGDVMLPNG